MCSLFALILRQAEQTAPGDATYALFKRIQIRSAADDLLHVLHNPALVRFAELSADTCRSMGVKEYYWSHLNAASKHSTLATAQVPSTLAATEERGEQRVTLVDGVDAASAPNKLSDDFSESVFSFFVFLYRKRKILSAAFILALASVILGLCLGDVISMMVLVVSLPTLIAFLSHWKCTTSYGSSYPVRWRIGFALFFAVAFSLSLSFMLAVTPAKALNAGGGSTYSDQAALMIFLICGLGTFLVVFLHLQYRYVFLLELESDPPTHCCGIRSVTAAQHLIFLKVSFVVIMLLIFVVALLGITGVINSQYLVICCS